MTDRKRSIAGALLKLGGAFAVLAAFLMLARRSPASAPAVMPAPARSATSARPEIVTYGIGYGVALLLTIAAFAVVHWHWAQPGTALEVVFALAIVQMVVHFRCFLHVTLHGPARDDLQLILFSTLIILMMVGGTLVILFNLRMRMM